MSRYTLALATPLAVSRERAWDWITSVDGILAEMRPLMRMTIPRGVERIGLEDVRLGEPLFASWVLLFGVIPVDRSWLTLVELDPGHGFVERSPMLGMKLWQHERWIETVPGTPGCTLNDRLSFEPRFAGPIVRWVVARFFRHRHAVLARRLGPESGASPLPNAPS